ncbi:MAG: flagellar biosynthesis anti-sigma factor FlgM [Oscillospiraceae bacterium]|nr:flagellar biosynthesis anti-sigma factor FlgM [Oscillospiraceae bacterium]
MKISPIINPNVLGSYQTTKSVSALQTAMSERDQVNFSDEALSFSKALAEAREMIEQRTPAETAHIADIKSAVRQGRYSINSEDVAKRILLNV